VKLRGNPEHPYSAGELCPKVNRFLDRVYDPGRILYPLRRVGPKGSGEFERVSWDDALAEIGSRLHAVIDEHGAEAVLPYSDAGNQGLLAMMGLNPRFFGHMGASKLLRAICGPTVGAGLPIIQTVRDLIQTGDRVRAIEGIFSGTLAYLFNAYDGELPFSEIVKQAKAQGYTEPDPRDDLSGLDVARKLVILAREAGMELELDAVEVESLVPAELESGSVAEFLERCSSMDAAMQDRFEAARAAGEVLRYVGSVDADGHAKVSVRRVPAEHAFGRIQLTDNIVQFRTARYDQNPLIVQGPGAGPHVTAGGVFADLLRLSEYLGATR